MRQRLDTKVLRDGLPEIRERRPHADVSAGTHTGAVQEHGHVLAGVIRTRCARIVAVIGRDHQQVVCRATRQQRGKPRVEPLEIRGVSLGIVPVSVHRVEVDEVGEDQYCRH